MRYGHGRGRRGAVPLLVTARAPDHVAGAEFDDLLALVLNPAATGRDEQGLAERRRAPMAPWGGLEGDGGAR
jgi:hypothetical protein